LPTPPVWSILRCHQALNGVRRIRGGSMQLHERLIDLLGHEVSVSTRLEGKGAGVSTGVVKEVGPDYLILVDKGARSDWWARMDAVVTIVHESSCPRCAAGPAA